MRRSLVMLFALAFISGHAVDVSADKSKKSIQPTQEFADGQVDRVGNVTASRLARAGLKRVTSLKYTIMLRNSDGTESAVDEVDYTFQMGDEFRLIVEADTDLYLYVFHESTDSLRTFLVPDRRDPTGYVPRLVRGKPLTVPRDGYFEVTPPSGIEKLMVFASPEKRAELTTADSFAQPNELSSNQRRILRTQQDQVFQTAMNVIAKRSPKADTKTQNGPRIRLRALSWTPKTDGAKSGRTVIVGSYDKDAKPDLFLTIPLSSKE